MPDPEIKSWDEIKENFQGADILLGNGFSINLYKGFNYSELFSSFLDSLPEPKKEIYSNFTSDNFEIILKDLTKANEINAVFGIQDNQICEAIQEIRNGLIRTVTDNHPRTDEIDHERINQIENQLEFFSKIYTLNYDIFLYYVILRAKERFDKKDKKFLYSDFFWRGGSKKYKFFEYPITNRRYIPVYYLHGAIFIFNNGFSAKKRVIDFPNCNLLEAIGTDISEGEIPLFISAGSSSEKNNLIRQNEYLTYCLNALTHNTETLVIYGASLMNQDQHIINAINLRIKRKIAISIYLNKSNVTQQKEEILRLKRLFVNQDLYFFDSSTLFS